MGWRTVAPTRSAPRPPGFEGGGRVRLECGGRPQKAPAAGHQLVMQRTRGLVSGACPGAQRRSLGWDGRTAGRGVLLADSLHTPARPGMRPPAKRPSPVRGSPLTRARSGGRVRPACSVRDGFMGWPPVAAGGPSGGADLPVRVSVGAGHRRPVTPLRGGCRVSASGSAAEVVTSGLLRLRTTTATAPAGRSAAPAGAASGRTTRRARPEPPGGLDLHFHGLDAAQVAAIFARWQEGR